VEYESNTIYITVIRSNDLPVLQSDLAHEGCASPASRLTMVFGAG
jgi:hypothetical protein